MPRPLYLAVGLRGLVVTSADGRSWTAGGTGKKTQHFFRACVGSQGAVIAGTENSASRLFFAPDGNTWTAIPRDGFPEKPLGFTSYQNGFIAVGGAAGTIGRADAYASVSTDGKTWSTTGLIGDGKRAMRSVATNGELTVAIGDRGAKFASTDLKTWKPATSQSASETLINVVWANGLFVGGGLHGLRMHSRDGVKWTRVEGGEEGEHINSLIWTGKEFVGVGLGATYRSPDGLKWSRTPNTHAPLSATYGLDGYVGTRWKGRIAHSPDAITWTEVAKFDSHLEFITFGLI